MTEGVYHDLNSCEAKCLYSATLRGIYAKNISHERQFVASDVDSEVNRGMILTLNIHLFMIFGEIFLNSIH